MRHIRSGTGLQVRDQHTSRGPQSGYWKRARPYLDGIDWTSSGYGTRVLAFVAGQDDMFSPYGVTIPLRSRSGSGTAGDLRGDADQRNPHLIINREKPPFNDPICGGRWR